MNKISIFFMLSLTLSWASEVKSQETGTHFKTSYHVGLPSPSASEFAKYGDIPISLHTGVPEISVPLYHISSADIQIPISVSYHASGIKVDQEATTVGLGWFLNAGYAVTRRMNGFPDEEYRRGFFKHYGKAMDLNNNSMDEEEEEQYLTDLVNFRYDGKPDIYNYSIAGESGKMMIDPESNVSDTYIAYSKPFTNTKKIFDLGANLNSKWIITNSKGLKYEFTQKEGSFTHPELPRPIIPAYTSSWYVTTIASSASDVVAKFEYETDTYATQHTTRTESYTRTSYLGYNHTACPSASDLDSYNISEQSTNQVRVKKITIERGGVVEKEIVFTYEAETLDVTVSKRLEQILVYTGSSSAGTLDKQFVFQYSHFSGRLKLTEIQEKSSSAPSLPPYTFQYFEDTGLPERSSYNKDHWGYFNNANNTTLIPEYQVGIYSFSGANRESDTSPNAKYTRAGTIKEITYPTGGFSRFEFEPNEYNISGSLFVDTLVVHKQEQKSAHVYGSGVDNIPLIIEHDQYIKIECRLTADDGYPAAGVNAAQILSASNATIFNCYSSGDWVQDSLVIQQGTYNLRAFSGVSWETAEITVTYETSELDTLIKYPSSSIVGGLRIKRIEHSDGGYNPLKILEYDYTHKSNRNISSGYLTRTLPSYIQQRYYDESPCSYLIRSSFPTLVFDGYHIGYKEVTERVITSGESNGEKVYHFSDSRDTSPNTPKDHLRGKLLEEHSYDKEGNSQLSRFYEWEFNDPRINHYFSGVDARMILILETIYWGGIQFIEDEIYYSLRTNWESPWQYQSKSVMQHSMNGPTVTTFNEFDPDHLNLTKVTTITNGVDTLITEYKYAHEYNPAMKGLHMLSQPYSVEVRNGNNEALKKHWTLWKDWGTQSNPQWLPCGTWAWDGALDNGIPVPPTTTSCN